MTFAMHSKAIARALVCGAIIAAPAAGAATSRTSHDDNSPTIDTLIAQARDVEREVREHLRNATEEMTRHLRDLDFNAATLAFAASEFTSARNEVVKNAPYSAEAISQSVQVLGDGNRIVKESRTLLARDSMGRTRQERSGPNARIYVFDPIEKQSFAINPERKTVYRIPRVPTAPLPPIPPVPPVPPVSVAPPAPTPPTPPAAGALPAGVEVSPGRVVVRRSGDGEQDVRVEVVRIPRDHTMLAPPAALTLPLLPRGKGETRALGTRDLGGIKAEGTETRHTIPAGEIGNEKPIVIASERWFSPELHVVVFAKTVDPRVGETSYRLANIKREEPSAELFKMPAGYRGARH
ncbi:MAG TPA: hypothetical protein VNG69_02465 [Casimicrobiaceae bacterium]|nr:hypothetical protein [Casimicrobiaceae bacterium]